MLSAVLFLGMTTIGFAAETPTEETPTNNTINNASPGNATTNTATTDTATVADETTAVEQATSQFYTSLNALLGGNASEMDQVWSHTDNVTYMGPVGGIQTGWNQVRTMWEVQADLKLGGHVEPTDLHFTVGNDLALVEGYELGSILDDQGQAQSFRIRATSSFRKENGQWKMIGHHTDLLEYLDGDSEKASEEQTGSSEQPSTNSNPQSGATPTTIRSTCRKTR